jgi:hypothetical protein
MFLRAHTPPDAKPGSYRLAFLFALSFFLFLLSAFIIIGTINNNAERLIIQIPILLSSSCDIPNIPITRVSQQIK